MTTQTPQTLITGSRDSSPSEHPPAERGLAIAGVTALVSGVAVFVNSYGVRTYTDATAYTTAKNAVAAVVLLLFTAATVVAARHRPEQPHEQRCTPNRPARWRRWTGMASIAVIGGSVPFVLFFEGLARASAKDAAFIHKTLVVWVAILAVTFLRERVGWLQVVAIALLIMGQWMLGVKLASLRPGSGELMIAAATLMWSVEVVVAKRLLPSVDSRYLGVIRMGGGVLLLLVWLGITGRLADVWPASGEAARWVMATGALLGLYVGTWYAALARARAVDVTAVLTLAIIVTALLDTWVKGTSLSPQLAGLGIVGAGVALAAAGANRSSFRRARRPAFTTPSEPASALDR